jgi:hypothetical protein
VALSVLKDLLLISTASFMDSARDLLHNFSFRVRNNQPVTILVMIFWNSSSALGFTVICTKKWQNVRPFEVLLSLRNLSNTNFLHRPAFKNHFSFKFGTKKSLLHYESFKLA